MAKRVMIPLTCTINCTYHGKVGKNTKRGSQDLWNARHQDYPGVCGAGNSAHNAIKDFRVQLKAYNARKARETIAEVVSSFRTPSTSSTPTTDARECNATNGARERAN
jgi:hypothetical protein